MLRVQDQKDRGPGLSPTPRAGTGSSLGKCTNQGSARPAFPTAPDALRNPCLFSRWAQAHRGIWPSLGTTGHAAAAAASPAASRRPPHAHSPPQSCPQASASHRPHPGSVSHPKVLSAATSRMVSCGLAICRAPLWAGPCPQRAPGISQEPMGRATLVGKPPCAKAQRGGNADTRRTGTGAGVGWMGGTGGREGKEP